MGTPYDNMSFLAQEIRQIHEEMLENAYLWLTNITKIIWIWYCKLISSLAEKTCGILMACQIMSIKIHTDFWAIMGYVGIN